MGPGVRLVILGKQGAGKGTQCVRLARHYVVPHISTGDVFRAAQKSSDELGNELREYIDRGELVPDKLTIEIVRKRLTEDNLTRRGFILDGFPRTVGQAEALSEMMAPRDIDLAIDIDIPTEVALRRLAGRKVCKDCGAIYGPDSPPRVDSYCDYCNGEVEVRADDTEEAIRRRLVLYEEQTAPIIDWYLKRGLLARVDGMGDVDEIAARMIRTVNAKMVAAAGLGGG